MNMNIALIGYGTMGHEIETSALQRGHSVIARFNSESLIPPTVSDFYKSNSIQCFIDFSTASLVRTHAEISSTLGIPLVEGTTGWQDQKKEILDRVRNKNGTMVYGSNFSVGAQMFFRIVQQASQLMDAFPDYDVAIHETHHTKKKDAPSGTALTIGDIILSQIHRKTAIKKQSESPVIQPNEIGITSTRIGSVPGIHSVMFNSVADEIELTHRAHNRSGFAFGAVLAAELIQNFSGVFSFEELLFEKSFTHQ